MFAPDTQQRGGDRLLAAVEEALHSSTTDSPTHPRVVSPGVVELALPTGEARAVRVALADAGFVPLAAPARDGALRVLGYLRDRGEWGEIRIKLADGRRPRVSALIDRIPRPLRRRGLGVALLGPDGAGKSTLVETVTADFPTPVRSIYMGLYQGEEEGGARARFRLPGVGLATNLLRQQGRWWLGAYHRARGRLVLFDRYTYDALLPVDGPLSSPVRVRRWLLAHACPRPDLVVVLDAPAAVLFARKGEHDPELLESHRASFRALQAALPGSVLLDTSLPAEASARNLVGTIWMLYARRWR